MKYFWKIFFSTMIICVLGFSIGSYFLVDASFNDSLKQEIAVARELSDIVHYSLVSRIKEVENLNNHSVITRREDLESLQDNWVSKIANSMSINNINGIISFRISDKDKNIVFSSLNSSLDNKVLSNISDNERGYTFKETDNGIYIHAFRPTKLLDNQYYIEVMRDVSHIFENRKVQYHMFIKIVVGMLVVGGIITAIISKLLMKPIARLTKATKEIATGDFSKQIPASSEDEFAVLSDNFNIMSRKLEEKINELKQEAEKQELFVASFSHELKTPLTSIIGYSDMLRSKEMDKERISLCADYIFNEGKRLETLSMRLLEMVVLKKQDIKTVKVSATEFFEDISQTMAAVLQDFKIIFVTEVEPAIISIEPELMKTVFINIVDNSRKAIGRWGEIILKGKIVDDGYVISVCDNGKGMEQEEFAKITQAFYMVDKSRARTEGGAGLGLALCDEILRMHGATIHFESKLYEGTCVTIHLKGVDSSE